MLTCMSVYIESHLVGFQEQSMEAFLLAFDALMSGQSSYVWALGRGSWDGWWPSDSVLLEFCVIKGMNGGWASDSMNK